MIVAAEKIRGWALPFEEFFRSEYAAVYRAAFLSTGSREAAQDATQEAFARAYSRWKRLRNQPWVGGWVMTTAMNLCKKHHKKSLLEASGRIAEETKRDQHLERRLDLSVAMRSLPLRQRTAIALFYLADLPLPQIAQLMQISEGTVKAHLAQARNALRGTLETTNE